MTKVLLVVNPSSGGEKAKDFQEMAKEKLAQHFEEVIVKHTEKAGDASDFAKEAAKEHYEAVFVMGGDGTVNEGISGLAEEEYRPKFGFFPLGTVNDLARALNMPLDPEEAIQSLDLTKTKSLDIGKINDNYFMNVVAVGTIPQAVNETTVEEKTKLGKFAYAISAFKNLAANQSYNFKVELDGVEKEIESSTVLIGLTNSIGGFEQLLPEAKVSDGLLHFLYLKDSNLLESLQTLPSLLTGVDESNNRVGYHQVKEVKVSVVDSEETLKVNVDGDEGDELPVEVKVLPSHLQVYA
ncbi:diacylglycerol/lipid kinase family protein [Streptococcus minor]|uniref:diacylglycerol/lipid kinase family protein n=1 Tax=Streptococcus minor TaxID=229549 RepID=UPI00037B7965|nr:diacylglycerol kinase family protein [Streptococcus minor]